MSVHSRQVTPSLLQIEAIARRLAGTPALEEVCRFLRAEFPHYAWVGVYRLEDPSTLVLDAWDGAQATEHVRIPVSRGVCGRAVREGQTVIVADVRDAPDYLACFLDTRSEIVVPIRRAGTIIGEIDVDGRVEGAYDDSDRRFLEAVAERLAPLMGVEGSAPSSPVPP